MCNFLSILLLYYESPQNESRMLSNLMDNLAIAYNIFKTFEHVSLLFNCTFKNEDTSRRC